MTDINTNEFFLPDPGRDGWSPAYLKIIRQAADEIIPNPVLAKKKGVAVWKMMTEEERDRADEILAPYWNMIETAEGQAGHEETPRDYLNGILMQRRYGWLEHWVNEWVVWQRELEV